MLSDAIGQDSVGLAGKSAPDIQGIATQNGSILVIPVGSVEQHGSHLPVFTDTILAEAVALQGAEAVADEISILVSPPLYPGISPHHVPFGGTLTLGFETLLHLLVDTAESAYEMGFDAVLFLNGHGGNNPLVGAVTSVLGPSHPDRGVYGLTYFELARPFIDDIRETDSGGMGHAGEFETSLLLHLRPELVDEESLEGTPIEDPNDYAVKDMFDEGPLAVYRPFTEYSTSGTLGDPIPATAAKGERILEKLEAELAAVLLEIRDELP